LLVERLRQAGHDVVTALEANLIGNRDEVVFEASNAQDRLVVALNCTDFIELQWRKLAVRTIKNLS